MPLKDMPGERAAKGKTTLKPTAAGKAATWGADRLFDQPATPQPTLPDTQQDVSNAVRDWGISLPSLMNTDVRSNRGARHLPTHIAGELLDEHEEEADLNDMPLDEIFREER